MEMSAEDVNVLPVVTEKVLKGAEAATRAERSVGYAVFTLWA